MTWDGSWEGQERHPPCPQRGAETCATTPLAAPARSPPPGWVSPQATPGLASRGTVTRRRAQAEGAGWARGAGRAAQPCCAKQGPPPQPGCLGPQGPLPTQSCSVAQKDLRESAGPGRPRRRRVRAGREVEQPAERRLGPRALPGWILRACCASRDPCLAPPAGPTLPPPAFHPLG